MAIPWHYVLAWFPLVVIALAVALLRDAVWRPRLAPPRERSVTHLLAAAGFGLYALAVVLLLPPGSAGEAWLVGGIWVVMTLAFELPIRLLSHRPPASLAEAEAAELPSESRFAWPLLVWMGAAPWLWFRLLSALR